jgi:hypothetical protein
MGTLLYQVRSAEVDDHTGRWDALLGLLDLMGCLRPEHLTMCLLSSRVYERRRAFKGTGGVPAAGCRTNAANFSLARQV